MTNKIFTKLTISTGEEVTFLECKGIHLFNASVKTDGNIQLASKFLITELASINGKLLTSEEIDEMSGTDVCSLLNVINIMLSDDFKL